jgi:hypothetical protein
MRDAMRVRPEGWAQVASRSVDRAVARLAAGQYGVVERGQLVALGLSGTAIGRWVEAGRLHRLHRGVYAVGHPLVPTRGRWLAAVLACGPGAALSHASAAALWSLRATDAVLLDVTLPGTGARRQPGLRVHRARNLAPADVATVDSIRVTSPARTILDVAATLDARALERVLDRAEREGVYDGRALAAVIAANRGHRGAARLRAILDEHVAGTTVTRSGIEERMLALCRGHGLPCPLVNHFVLGVEVDFVFPGTPVLVEADSWRYHRSRAQFARDRERDGILARAGYRVLRFADEQIVGDPGLVAATIAAALANARRADVMRVAPEGWA